MRQKRALMGLWALPGVGPRAVERVSARFDLSQLAELPIKEWCDEVELPSVTVRHLAKSSTLGALGDAVFERAAKSSMSVTFKGDASYPARLAEVTDAPPVLFHWGPGAAAPPRRRVAMVGTRHPDEACVRGLTGMIRDVARAGVGVISGAAFGIDTLAHRQAAEEGGETWAFVGSALDELDTHQRKLWHALQGKGATFWSELPPGVRADRRTFPRRNRLISGSADAVAVLRAGRLSGTRYTVRYALAQSRKLLAWPAEPQNPNGELCLELIKSGHAEMCTSVDDVLEAVGLGDVVQVAPELKLQVDETASLSDDARVVLERLERTPKCFDELLLSLPMQSPQLVTSLAELTHAGLVIEQSGRRYLRV